MYKNISKTKWVLKDLENPTNLLYEWEINLIKKRLNYVNNLNLETFNNYIVKIQILFELFK